MALIVTKGYLVARYDYSLFDEILTFINEYGVKFVCFAPGTRRISSKNARALQFGNFLEFQVFYSEKPDKLSKLKKVVALKSIEWKYENRYDLLTLSEFISKMNEIDEEVYKFYQEVLFNILNDQNQFYVLAYILVKLITINGAGMNFNRCTRCGSTNHIKTISIRDLGLVCTACLDPLIDKVYPLKMMKMWREFTLSNEFIVHDWYTEDNAKLLIVILKEFIMNTIGVNLVCLKSLRLESQYKKTKK